MSLLSGKELPLWVQEKKIKQYAQKDANDLLSYNRQVYRLAAKLFSLLPFNRPPKDDQEKVLSILILRALECSRAIELLVRCGYLSAAAGLSANIIETFVQAKYVAGDKSVAAEWLSHTGNFTVWKFTGDKGLFKKLDMPMIQDHYQELCAIKHSQSKSMRFNFETSEGTSSYFSSPTWDKGVARQILGYGISALGDVAYYYFDTLRDVYSVKDAEDWEKKFYVLQSRIRETFTD